MAGMLKAFCIFNSMAMIYMAEWATSSELYNILSYKVLFIEELTGHGTISYILLLNLTQKLLFPHSSIHL
jgi:hypothetical protein